MAQYKLLTDHVTSEGRLLPAGTVVGDDTDYPWDAPLTHHMVGVDDAGRHRLDAFYQEKFDHPGPKAIKSTPVTQERQPSDEPVSEQQKKEKGDPNAKPDKPANFTAPEGAGDSQGLPMRNPRDVDLAEGTRPADQGLTRPVIDRDRKENQGQKK